MAAKKAKAKGFARIARGAGIAVGGVVGAAGALNAIRVASEKFAVDRVRRADDPFADEHFGELKADRDYTVVATDGVPIYVEEVGSPDASLVIVFAHGYTLNMGSFHFQRQALRKLRSPSVRMVFYDQRSHGKSGRSRADDCTIDQLGRDLREIIRTAAGDRPVILIGHSMGGMTVMGLADIEGELFGDQVLGVALLSTSAGNVVSTLRAGRMPKSLVERALPLLAKGAQAAPKALESARGGVSNAMWLLIRRFSFGSAGAPASLADYVDRMIAATPVDVVADFYRTLAGHDKVAALPALRNCEVLVMCGDEDRITPMEHSELLARELPEAELFVVPGAGHMAMMEKHELVDLRLQAFIHRAYKRSRPQAKKRA
ncbi:pimeloyl-ACP methyl ester carboxylesterase [Antricoccus suffuscus]|uniref:Pimeloyl-ACP methyl ester carboxylesterase n=1 Tax=Antricoccus suffuscus TaxID=1629062 RepID=A0A2T0Z3R0_9ACTN|nr:alpha/beta hydrolase [Antricoccus suffuscus]PRZ30784.1 pimeloyl-ACP methyl ester carboxylesterase [Antricoccus suffuscus]